LSPQYTEKIGVSRKSGTSAKKEIAALNFCKNAKYRTAIVHSYDIDFISLMVYNIE